MTRQDIRVTLPLAAAVALFGVSFGVLARAEGLDPLAVVAFSMTTFAGSAQFAAVAVLSAGGSVAAAVVAGALLNARYLGLGLSVAGVLPGGPLRRLLLAQLVVDESWALGSEGGGRFSRGRLVGAGLVLWAAWVAGTALGVVGGSALADPNALGLDAAFPALFLSLLAGQIRMRRDATAALAAAVIALATTPLLPAGLPLVLAALVCLVVARRSPA